MKKALILMAGLLLVLGMSQAWADTLNGITVTAVTVFDQHGNGDTSGTQWYGNQEYKEVEPGAATGNNWDFRGVWYDAANKALYVVAGFDMSVGAGDGTFTVGDLFIRTGGVIPNLTLDGVGGVVNNGVYTADGLGYTIAIQGGTAYLLTATSQLQQANATSSVGEANPYILLASGETVLANNLVTYGPVTSGTGTETTTGATLALTGDYYACYDLSFLSFADIADSFYHLSYSCGNDGVNGYVPQGAVPLPGAIVLLGAGLLRLAAYRRRSHLTS